ncbi:hypothetical protein C8R43DRAFT_1004787, partial [Mycena crocata]
RAARPPPIALILAALSAPLCASAAGNLSALMAHAGDVKELWPDMVYDAELWDALDLAWEVVFGGVEFGGAVSSSLSVLLPRFLSVALDPLSRTLELFSTQNILYPLALFPISPT